MTKDAVTRTMQALLRFPVSAARRIQAQAAKEDRARVSDQFAALDNGLSYTPHLMRRPLVTAMMAPALDDPLEVLWRLPSRQPTASR